MHYLYSLLNFIIAWHCFLKLSSKLRHTCLVLYVYQKAMTFLQIWYVKIYTNTIYLEETKSFNDCRICEGNIDVRK